MSPKMTSYPVAMSVVVSEIVSYLAWYLEKLITPQNDRWVTPNTGRALKSFPSTALQIGLDSIGPQISETDHCKNTTKSEQTEETPIPQSFETKIETLVGLHKLRRQL